MGKQKNKEGRGEGRRRGRDTEVKGGGIRRGREVWGRNKKMDEETEE